MTDELTNIPAGLDLGSPKVLELVLELKQYPILSRAIRERMRQEIFSRGVITPEAFEHEAHLKAQDSQAREGLTEPYAEEPPDVWQQRVSIIRDDLTDFYFAHNCPHSLFEQIVQEMLVRRMPDREVILTVNPELAPWSILFALGERYESLPPERRSRVQHHLQESIVVLTKGMLSDQLDFVGLAREFLTIGDLKEIRRRRIGRGKIGGKSAGMMLAWKILRQARSAENASFCDRVSIPESYFVAADVFYEFQALNNLIPYMNQKYKSREEIQADYPQLRQLYLEGQFPTYVLQALRGVLEEVGQVPLVVRSSSLLEDNFGFSFAGKYDSFFLGNQGTPEENLDALIRAIAAVYASVISPDALIYRRHMGLLDYDERMAVLIQKVIGQPYNGYYFPALAGVAFSRNPFRWNPRIRSEDGLVRLVCGLGTRAVDREANDYPRMIALSHPNLRPTAGAQAMRYTQRFIDTINLNTNAFEPRPLAQVMGSDYDGLRLLASIDKGGYVQPILSRLDAQDPNTLVLTFDTLLAQTDFVPLIKFLIKTIEKHYKRPVDIEFAMRRLDGRSSQCEITLLQCRPLSFRQEGQPVRIPTDLPPASIIFSASKLAPQGVVSDIRYIVWIHPARYDQIQDATTKLQVARVVGLLNLALEKERFILMGPGRWGSSNLDLGVKVTYADINNSQMLIEVALARGDHTPEVSYGTHFFQDLVESQIYPLPLYPDDRQNAFNWEFFEQTPNVLAALLPEWSEFASVVKVIDVLQTTGRTLKVVMNSDEERAVGYLEL